MFGNLRTTQPDVCSQLQDLVKAVPNALLFYGSPFTGRMYASLQLCKVLEVPSNNIIILSDRNHSDRILTALKLYKKNRNNSAKSFLKESVSVLLQQYHGALLDATTATGKKKFSDAAEVIDLLSELDTCNESEADKLADKLEKALLPLMDNKSALSVGQVRAIRDWCNTTSMDGQQKYVIIEGVENASDSAINALLKTLEEPPEGCHFILISSNAGRIPATILSRVRKLRFNDLGETQKKSILNSLFVNANDYPDLETFFLQNSGCNDKLLQQCAKALIEKQKFDVPELVKELETNQNWDRFFKLVINEIQSSFNEGKIEQRRAQYLLDAVNECVIKGKSYNQTKRLTFDFVLYRIMEVNK